MLLVDAYNVLMVDGVLPPHLAGLDLTGLAALLAISRYSRHQAVLVCDGRAKDPQGQLGARVTARYSGPDRTADDLILSILASHTAPRTVILITSDRALASAARRRRAETLRSEEFLTHLARDEASGGRTKAPRPMPPVPLEKGQVEAWLREFGYPAPEPRARSGDPPRSRRPVPSKPAPSPPAKPAPPSPPAPVDPLLLAAVEAWAGRLNLSELDMERWLSPQAEKKPTAGR